MLECRVSKTKLFLYFSNPTIATRRANTSVKIIYIGLKKPKNDYNVCKLQSKNQAYHMVFNIKAKRYKTQEQDQCC